MRRMLPRFSTNNRVSERLSSSVHSSRTINSKTLKTNTPTLTFPNRFDITDVADNNEMIFGLTNETFTYTPIFITIPVDFNDFCKPILSIIGENGFECNSSINHLLYKYKLSTISIYSYCLIIHLRMKINMSIE